MAVLDLDESSHGDTFEVLLRLLEDEVGAWYGPALCYARERDRASGAQTHVVRRADGEVGKEKEITNGVGAELEVADRDAVDGGATERAEVDGLDVDRGPQRFEGFLCLRVEWVFVGRELQATFAMVVCQYGIA
jgi:hypothetical protein